MIRSAVAVAVCAAAVVVPVQSSHAAPKICTSEIASNAKFQADVDRLDEDVLGLDGRTLDLGPDAMHWSIYDPTDSTFTNRFHSLAWTVLAWEHGFPSVEYVVRHASLLPDPGSGASQATLLSSGWTEGSVRLRMGTVSCLYQLSGDERLVGVMGDLVAASLDPFRYRGRPLNNVHNHGALANITLMEAARVFERPDWRLAAVGRFDADASAVFSACGMSREQSTQYHLLNVNIWTRLLDRLHDEDSIEFGGVAPRVIGAVRATELLSRPDGILDAIGDGNRSTGVSAAEAESLGLEQSGESLLNCVDRGWLSHRSSWDDTATHYVLRYGARPALHGHEDRGAPTWFTQGVPVFSDRGLFDKKSNARSVWARGPDAHSVFGPVDTPLRGVMRLVAVEHLPDEDVIELAYDKSDVRMRRTVTISMDTEEKISTIKALDTASSPTARAWRQRWQLDESWTVQARTSPNEPAAFHSGSGLYLYGACSDGRPFVPQTREVETYPRWRESAKASAFECEVEGRRAYVNSVWVVSPTHGTLDWNRTTGTVRIVPDGPPEVSEGEVAGSAA